MKNYAPKKNRISEEISEEVVFKTYDDNALINFEVTLSKHDKKYFTLISGLPDNGEIFKIDTLDRIIECLKAAKKKWKDLDKN